MTSDSVVLDSNAAIAFEKQALGQPLNTIEQLTVARVNTLGSDLRVTDTVISESNLTTSFGRVPLEVDKTSSEFQSLLSKLEQPGQIVGGTSGVNDRQIVAETFFAGAESGVTPRLVTADRQIYNNLARIAGINPAKLGGSTVPKSFPDGFNVTINGKTIRVIAIAK